MHPLSTLPPSLATCCSWWGCLQEAEAKAIEECSDEDRAEWEALNAKGAAADPMYQPIRLVAWLEEREAEERRLREAAEEAALMDRELRSVSHDFNHLANQSIGIRRLGNQLCCYYYSYHHHHHQTTMQSRHTAAYAYQDTHSSLLHAFHCLFSTE